MRILTCLVLLTCLSCKRPDPAPTELDDLAHFFLAQAQLQEHERILEGAGNLAAWFDASGLAGEEASGGELTDLTTEEIDALEELRWEPDPSLCAGVYVVSELPCSLDEAAAIALEPDQTLIFPDTYDDYDRTYEQDPSCYPDGACDAVDWVSEIDDSLIGSLGDMSYEVVVKLRRSRDEEGVPGAFLVRSIMPEPADEDISFGGFEQSYHIEVYQPRGAGTLHMYAMWSYGWVFSSDPDDNMWPQQYLKQMLENEARVAEVCVEGW